MVLLKHHKSMLNRSNDEPTVHRDGWKGKNIAHFNRLRQSEALAGEMAEWFNAHAWKA
jgi:hypothetical protein